MIYSLHLTHPSIQSGAAANKDRLKVLSFTFMVSFTKLEVQYNSEYCFQEDDECDTRGTSLLQDETEEGRKIEDGEAHADMNLIGGESKFPVPVKSIITRKHSY